jgi:3-phenylpropionate/cinnamic acid dioxygenase small subunit
VSSPETLFRLSALNTAYAATIDADRLEDWPGFFTEDCLYKITTDENHRRGQLAGIVYADSRGMLEDRVAALRRANIYERQSYRHIIGMPSILSDDTNGIRAETPFLVVRTMRTGEMSLFAAGRYLDHIPPMPDGTWRFAERLAICDSPRFDTLLAIPL